MEINGYNFTFGADPEFFVQKGGKPVSAFNLVKGTKHDPFKVNKGAVQVDGMALEFNIDPAADYEKFSSNLDVVLKQIMEMVPGYEIYDKPVAEFGADYIEKQPKEAKELGCNPDYNAYTGLANPRPNGAAGFRTAAGHIHIGWTHDVDPKDPGHFNACCRLVKQLDRYLGVPSLIWDQDKKRRDLYGQAGAFRPTHFGVEYRVLSNSWLLNPMHNFFLRKYVIHQTAEAIKSLFKDPESADKTVAGYNAREVVNSSDVQAAKVVLEYEPEIMSPRRFRNEILGMV